jgi:hypothetical protein
MQITAMLIYVRGAMRPGLCAEAHTTTGNSGSFRNDRQSRCRAHTLALALTQRRFPHDATFTRSNPPDSNRRLNPDSVKRQKSSGHG